MFPTGAKKAAAPSKKDVKKDSNGSVKKCTFFPSVSLCCVFGCIEKKVEISNVRYVFGSPHYVYMKVTIRVYNDLEAPKDPNVIKRRNTLMWKLIRTSNT